MPGYRSTQLPVWGFDVETPLISEDDICPAPVCYSITRRRPSDPSKFDHVVIADGDPDFWRRIEEMLQRCADGKLAIVGQTIDFDMGSISKAKPHLIGLIFKCYAAGGVFDIGIREKLLNLSTHGQLEYERTPDGSDSKHITYKLTDFEKKYLGLDRTVEKKADDGWRRNYGTLSGKKACEYPAEALQYVTQDSLSPVLIFEAQDDRVESPDGGPATLITQEFRAGVAYCLRLMTLQGFRVDPDEFHRIEVEMEKLLSNEAMQVLIDHGIMRPAQPAKVASRQPKNRPAGEPPVMTEAKPSSIDTKRLGEWIEKVCTVHGFPVKKTPGGRIAASADVLEELAAYDAVLSKYVDRQAVQKIVTTYLPAMKRKDGTVAPRVHANFSVIVETLRTSSWGDENYPSTNIQNQDPRTRSCYLPDEPDDVSPLGWVLCSVDVSGMELVSLGWKCKQLFGHSALLDLLNQGEDAHAFLGAQIAFALHHDFNTHVRASLPHEPSKMEIYQCFKACKKGGEQAAAFYKLYRKLAKPTGLGYPGGLGPATFITFARTTYDVRCTIEEATRLREIWFDTYPEMRPYFDWITNNCQDPRNPVIGHKNGRPITGHAYFSPMGMYRAGCTFTAAANGAALQTPSAEAATLAVWEVSRAAYDPSYRSCLYGIRPGAFIHDEILSQIPRDRFMHERATEISRIMRESIGRIFTGAVIRCDPALMECWNKDAEPVYGSDGRLEIWRPSKVG